MGETQRELDELKKAAHQALEILLEEFPMTTDPVKRYVQALERQAARVSDLLTTVEQQIEQLSLKVQSKIEGQNENSY